MKKSVLNLSYLLLAFVLLASISNQMAEEHPSNSSTPGIESVQSDTPTVRRCRVIKRYRPKGEVYRMSMTVDNSLIQFRDLDSDNDVLVDVVDKKPEGFDGYVTFQFLDNNGKPIDCTGPIKLAAIKSKGKDGKEIEFESEDIEAKTGGNFLCGKTDHFLYPVNIRVYNSEGKLMYTQNTTFNFKSENNPKNKKEEIFESGEILDGEYKTK
jgi:hypothetical protein